MPHSVSQPSEESVLSESVLSESVLSESVIGNDSHMTSGTESSRLQFSFSSQCDWNHSLEDQSVNCDLFGYITGYISRIGSSSNSSDRGNQNLSSRGNSSKQLIFVNGRLVEYKKVELIEGLNDSL